MNRGWTFIRGIGWPVRLAALGTVAVVGGALTLAGVAGASASGTPGPHVAWTRGFAQLGGSPLRAARIAVAGPMQRALRSSIPAPGHDSEAVGISCVTASDCWAVGSYRNHVNAFLSEALHWNGKKWSRVTTPGLSGKGKSGDENVLDGVACVNASDCWAVGFSHVNGGPDLNVALRWNGNKWRTVKTPDPAGTASGDSNELDGVTCVSSSDCWAVGSHQGAATGAPSLNEALHWNGKVWSRAKVPDLGRAAADADNILFGIACVSASDCWAVGRAYTGAGTATRNQVLHWAHRKWSIVKTPDPAGGGPNDFNAAYGVTCPSRTDCWAVGEHGNTGARFNEALRFNGKKWSAVSTPQPGTEASEFGNPLEGVACTSTQDCWAVGYYVTKNADRLKDEALHWNGKTWSHVHTPHLARGKGSLNGLFSVACPSASDCRAVGTEGPSLEALINQALHWNGTRWSSG